MSDFEKPLVRTCFFEKSYKNIRTSMGLLQNNALRR